MPRKHVFSFPVILEIRSPMSASKSISLFRLTLFAAIFLLLDPPVYRNPSPKLFHIRKPHGQIGLFTSDSSVEKVINHSRCRTDFLSLPLRFLFHTSQRRPISDLFLLRYDRIVTDRSDQVPQLIARSFPTSRPASACFTLFDNVLPGNENDYKSINALQQ